MELTTTLNTLETIKNELNKINRYAAETAISKINDLIIELKTEILNESTTGSLNKNRNKKIASWHKKQLKTIRPVLAYSTTYKDYQVLTDSYFMAALKEDDKTALIPDYTESKRQYPIINQLINNAILYLNDNIIKLDIEKIAAILKLNDQVYISLNGEIIHVINKEAFKNTMLFLNISSNADIKTISFNKNILYFESINGSIGFIQTLRIDNNNTPDNTITATFK